MQDQDVRILRFQFFRLQIERQRFPGLKFPIENFALLHQLINRLRAGIGVRQK